MNLNEYLGSYLKHMKALNEDIESAEKIMKDDIDADFDERDTEFGDNIVPGDSFENDGKQYSWDAPAGEKKSDVQIWSAYDEDGNTVYFKVDTASGEILSDGASTPEELEISPAKDIEAETTTVTDMRGNEVQAILVNSEDELPEDAHYAFTDADSGFSVHVVYADGADIDEDTYYAVKPNEENSDVESDLAALEEEFGEEARKAFDEYTNSDPDMVENTLYYQSGWEEFLAWVKDTKGMDISDLKTSDGLSEALAIQLEIPAEGMPVSPEVAEILGDEGCCCSEDCVTSTATKVMASYQNANKWMDIIKEFLFTELGCVFFSSYIHNLAHTMPVRFDAFGDILHTVDMKIPYPETAYIPQEPKNVDDVFELVFGILDDIKNSLNEFISCTDEKYHGMACASESLLNDIEKEYVPLYKMKKAWEGYHDNMRFDRWVGTYAEKRGDLNESLSENWRDDLDSKNADAERLWKGHIIVVNELGEEMDAGEISYHGDRDGWEIYAERKCDRVRARYPEAQRVFLEDRTGWDSRRFWDEDSYNVGLDDIIELIEDELSKDETYSEDEIARMFMGYLDNEEEIEGAIETLREVGYSINRDSNESLSEVYDDEADWDYGTESGTVDVIVDKTKENMGADTVFNGLKDTFDTMPESQALDMQVKSADSMDDYFKVTISFSRDIASRELPETETSPSVIDYMDDGALEDIVRDIIDEACEKLDFQYTIDRYFAEEKYARSNSKGSWWTDYDDDVDGSLTEDTVKTKDGKWTNKGDEGTHGKFRTEKEADAQRKAMFANGYKG